MTRPLQFMIPQKLTKLNIEQLKRHLCSLQGEDRRLRFGGVVTDEFIQSYVEKSMIENEDRWFGCISKCEVVAACHVAIYNGEGELGCSVDKEYRGHGLAQLMFDRAVTYLRSFGITTVYMHCLTENNIMRHIAKKNDMTIVSCYGETDAKVEVAPGNPMTIMQDAYLDRIAIYDMMFRTNAEMYEAFLKNFKYGKRNHITRSSS